MRRQPDRCSHPFADSLLTPERADPSPARPARSLRLRLAAKRCESIGQTILQVANSVRDVRNSRGLVADFALDAERAAVADFLQRLHELLDVRLSASERHFLAPLSRYFRTVRVLDVDAADIGTQNLDRPDRIALVVEEHVGGVE